MDNYFEVATKMYLLKKIVTLSSCCAIFTEILFVHRNPVRAPICKSVSDYRWSSHHVYVSTAKKPDWLYTDFLLWLDYWDVYDFMRFFKSV